MANRMKASLGSKLEVMRELYDEATSVVSGRPSTEKDEAEKLLARAQISYTLDKKGQLQAASRDISNASHRLAKELAGSLSGTSTTRAIGSSSEARSVHCPSCGGYPVLEFVGDGLLLCSACVSTWS